MIKITGGQRIDLLGVRKEDLPGVWADLDMPSGYAYGKSFRTVKTLRRHRLLPLRPGRLDRRSASRLEQTLPGPGEPGEDEAGRGRLPAQLLGGAGQGRRGGRGRRRPVGRADRRRGRGVGAARRRAGDRRRARRGGPAGRGVHAVLPGERASGWSARTTSCRGSGSTSSRRSWSTTATASSPAWRSGCRPRSTPTATRGRTGASPSGPGQFANNLPLLPLPIVPVRPRARREPAGVVGGPRPGGERTVRERGGTVSDYGEAGAQA